MAWNSLAVKQFHSVTHLWELIYSRIELTIIKSNFCICSTYVIDWLFNLSTQHPPFNCAKKVLWIVFNPLSHWDRSFYSWYFSKHTSNYKYKESTNKDVPSRIWTTDTWSGKQWWRPLLHYATPPVALVCLLPSFYIIFINF